MFAELLAHPGVTEELELRSSVGFLAFHGGSLEQGTDDIAREAARRAGASFYAVVQPPDLRWHVPSTQFDPAVSPHLRAVLDHVDVAIAVHGFGREGLFTSLLLGGTNRELASHVALALRGGLEQHGYAIVDDVDAIPAPLRGQHPDNPVNRPRAAGVQLELPPRVRGLGPFWEAENNRAAARDSGTRTPHTEALIDALAGAARGWARRTS
jgi:phage replication-related protein YjqB (UPF0714/DUF867 family)